MTAIEVASAALPSTGEVPYDELQALTSGWLLAKRSPLTREAYLRDLRGWLAFCADHGVEPLAARLRHADAYGRWLTERAEPPPLSDASAARKMAAASSWYT